MTSAPGSDADRPNPGLPPALAAYTEYEVVRELGRGGMGVVYLARNRLMDRLEALKLRAGSEHAGVFIREVQAAARLTHPNIVAVYSARMVLGTVVLAMEYVDGCDLARLVADRGPLPVPDACELVRQAALGLQHAHDAGVVHRDIKPANLILSFPGGRPTVKVLDFGVARSGAGGADESAGTPAFAAPEQFAEPRRVDARSDLYALGGTLYFLLTGDQPFPAESGLELLRQHREDPPPQLDAVRYGVSADVAGLVSRMLAKDPADRPQTAAEVAGVLARYGNAGDTLRDWAVPQPAGADTIAHVAGGTPALGGVLTMASTVNLGQPPARTTGRGRRVWAGFAAGVLAAGLCAGWAGRGQTDSDDETPGESAKVAPVGPVPLSDGTSLAGWVVDGGDASEWQVENGAITTTGTRNGPRTWLLSDRDYGDCRVTFEYRLEAGGNTGFVFRAVPGECPPLLAGRPTPGPYHQQVEISDDAAPRWVQSPTGQVNGAGTSTGPALKPKQKLTARAGEWHRMEVEFRGQMVWVRVDGEELLADDLTRLIRMGSPFPGLHRAKGRIGFQQQLKSAAFRNVTIEEFAP